MKREDKQERVREAVRRLEMVIVNEHEPHDHWVFSAVHEKITELSLRYEVAAFSGRRTDFVLSQEEYDGLLDASKPVPYIVAGGMEPVSPRQRAERVWKELGKKYGFKWQTVRPVEEFSARHFSAELGCG